MPLHRTPIRHMLALLILSSGLHNLTCIVFNAIPLCFILFNVLRSRFLSSAVANLLFQLPTEFLILMNLWGEIGILVFF